MSDSTPTLPSSAGSAEGAHVSIEHAAAECPRCFTELQSDRDWWRARPAGSRLVGLVVSRPDMPTVKQQRDDLTRFGVPIEGFRHPAPETLEGGRTVSTASSEPSPTVTCSSWRASTPWGSPARTPTEPSPTCDAAA